MQARALRVRGCFRRAAGPAVAFDGRASRGLVATWCHAADVCSSRWPGGLQALCRRCYDLALDETGDLCGFLAAAGTSLTEWLPVFNAVNAEQEPRFHAALQWLLTGLRQQLCFPVRDCALLALAQSGHARRRVGAVCDPRKCGRPVAKRARIGVQLALGHV